MLCRARLLLLLLALLFSFVVASSIVVSDDWPWAVRIAALASLCLMGLRWVRWYSLGDRRPGLLAVDLAALALVTATVANALEALPLLYAGLFYRSLFDRGRQVVSAVIAYASTFAVVAFATLDVLRWVDVQGIVVHLPGLASTAAVAYLLAAMLRRQHRLIDALAASERRFRILVEQIPVGVLRVSADGRITYVSPHARALLGCDGDECVGDLDSVLERFVSHADRSRAALEVTRALQSTEPWSIECRVLRRSGEPAWIRFDARPVLDELAGATCWLVSLIEQSGEEQLTRELARRAFHDPLTGVHNRSSFMDRLQHAMARLRRSGARVAVLFLDLDDFKVVNDSFGHRVGDRLLQVVAERLVSVLRPHDTVARLGGDEFVLLLDDLEDEGQARTVAERILERVTAPIDLGGQPVYLTTSIGIAVTDDPWLDPDELLRRADLSMYEAKRAGRNRYAVFDASMEGLARDRFEVACGLHRALDNRELTVHYQPVVELDTGALRELEASVQWLHPERGWLPHRAVVDIAEESGLVTMIDQFLLETACQQLAAWREALPACRDLVVSVTLSGRHLRDPDAVERILGTLERAGLPPSRLCIAVPERAFARVEDAVFERVSTLGAVGVRLAVVDVGSGGLSLQTLSRLSIDRLRLDRTLVDGLAPGGEGDALIQVVTSVAAVLGLTVVADGIVTAEQARRLCRLGCCLGQGPYFGAPQPAPAIASLLERASLVLSSRL